jgi:EpsI family protein
MRARLLILAACMLAAAAYLARGTSAEAVPAHRPLSELPLTIGGWQGTSAPEFDRETLAVLRVDDYVNRWYTRSDGAVVSLYVGYYETQREGDTIHSPMNCLPGAGWQPVEADRLTVPVSGRDIETNRYIIQKGADKQLVLYWYRGRGRDVASEYWSRALLMLDAVRLHRTDGALIRVISPITQNTFTSEATATNFVKALYPMLTRYLPG